MSTDGPRLSPRQQGDIARILSGENEVCLVPREKLIGVMIELETLRLANERAQETIRALLGLTTKRVLEAERRELSFRALAERMPGGPCCVASVRAAGEAPGPLSPFQPIDVTGLPRVPGEGL